jgi:hypothetical protein
LPSGVEVVEQPLAAETMRVVPPPDDPVRGTAVVVQTDAPDPVILILPEWVAPIVANDWES